MKPWRDDDFPSSPAGIERRTDPVSHWEKLADRWAKLGPPMRPHPEDVRRFETCAAAQGVGLRALLLGVTPEIASMHWPVGSSLVAIDRSIPMIKFIWPRERIGIPSHALASDWRRLPLGDGSLDLAIGDGCLSALGAAAVEEQVLREVKRVLRPGGHLIMRLFAAPAIRESPSSVFSDLLGGRIGAFDAFKWRLLMAAPAHGDDHTVRLGDAFDLWEKAHVDRDRLAQATGWSRARIDTIDDYRNNDTLLDFPPLAETLARVTPFFRVDAIFTQNYELAERCPIVVLSRSGA